MNNIVVFRHPKVTDIIFHPYSGVMIRAYLTPSNDYRWLVRFDSDTLFEGRASTRAAALKDARLSIHVKKRRTTVRGTTNNPRNVG